MQINNNSHFAMAPSIQMQRSSFDRPHTCLTSFDSATLVPCYVDSDILPGDTVSMDMSFVVRQSTPIHPVFGNANVEFMWFFCPHRLVYDRFESFMTEGRDRGAWDPPRVFEPPMINIDVTSVDSNLLNVHCFQHKSLADYMGIPVGKYRDAIPNPSNPSETVPLYSELPSDGVSALPFRAYVKIWNDWFRASTVQEEILIPSEVEGLQTVTVDAGGKTLDEYLVDEVTLDSVYGGKLLKANKYHDFFTSALLEPQAGEPVGIPLTGAVPVTISDNLDDAMRFQVYQTQGLSGDINKSNLRNVYRTSDSTLQLSESGASNSLFLPGQEVDLASSLASVSINDLRHAIAIQHILELDARSGFTYKDLLRGHFSVTSPDARLQRAEYLGGTSVPINIDQVLQTSATDSVSPQGNTAAYSLTSGNDHVFDHSFTEHGTLMCLAVVRHVHTYQQGLDAMWTRRDRYDYYWPALANISEQPIYTRQLFMSNQTPDDQVFGYQEAWADYRYKPSIVTGAMRSSYPQSLDVWHYADYYDSVPYLSEEWLEETKTEIDRTLAVSSDVEDQFIADLFFNPRYYRVMPLYSVPGLDRI